MPLNVRRVVTGHDADGRAVVKIDETSTNLRSSRPGHEAAVIWTTQGYPVDNDGDEDTQGGAPSGTIDDGTVFRIIEYGPGVAPRMHRTDTIDYAVVMSGEIDMRLDGETVHLRAGDVVVQRGTLHDWVNNGTEPCVIAFVLIGAKPVESSGGQRLEAKG
jgi:mannose-6-phosphate isomerase-like protein (cupin superfamily)